MEQSLAQEITKNLADANELCSESLRTVMGNDSLGITQVYGRLVGNFMGYSYTNILAPLWLNFPELEPPEMKEPYIEPVPLLSEQSKTALSNFVYTAKLALIHLRKNVSEQEGKTTFQFGGIDEVEESLQRIEDFLHNPRHRDESPAQA
jgi:hypothetical protein